MGSMNRREFLQIAAMAIQAAATRLHAVESSVARKPNVIFIFADQMRFSAMSCMKGIPGAEIESRNLHTPNLDRLASDGILFKNAFSTTPVCSPYRTGIQTGMYSHTSGYKLQPDVTALPMCFKKAGYSTGYIGKWHISPVDFLSRKERGPMRHYVDPKDRKGWDFWAGHEVSHQYFGKKGQNGALYFLNDSRKPVLLKEEEYEPKIQADMAIEYLKKNLNNPFLLCLSFGPPHNPYIPPRTQPPLTKEKIKLKPNVPKRCHNEAREVLSNYYAQVQSLDTEVGRILDALKKNGLEDNTVVWFSSDHGDMLFSQEDQNKGKTPGMKRRPWDEAARIPGIIRWPARIKGAQRSDMLLGSVNYMPTMLGFAGLSIPTGVQGRDLSRAILGDEEAEEDEIFLEQTQPGNTPYSSPWRAIRTKRYLYAESGHIPDSEWLLYDVQDDPYQQKNLIQDPDSAEMKVDLQGKLSDWRKRTGDTQDLQAAATSFRKRKTKR